MKFYLVYVCFTTNQPWQGQSLQMKGELGSPRLGLSPCHIFAVGLEVLRPQDILAMWSRFSGCAHKHKLTHVRGRDHREWGQGRGGPWGGNSDRNMH